VETGKRCERSKQTQENKMMGYAQEFSSLAREKKKIGLREAEIIARMALLQEALVEEYQQQGLQRMTVDGVTIYLAEEIWAGGMKTVINGIETVDRQGTCNALIDAGYPEFVKVDFNVNTVSAWVRELDRNENGDPILPVMLEGRINIAHVWKLKTRISG